jgi:tight adherence protein B
MLLSITCAALMFVVLVGWLHPRLTTHLDRRLTVPRLVQPLILDQRDAPKDSFTVADPRISTSVEMVEELIRLTRSGVHARDALNQVFAQDSSISSHFTSATHTHSSSISEVLLNCAQSCETARQHDDAHMCRMLKASFVHGVFVPSALEHVVTTLRTRHSIRADIRTASAQAMFTVRILTHLPLVAFAILLVSSADMRSRIFHLSTLVVLALGIFLNRLGAWWIHRLIAHTVNRPADETIALAEQLAASLRAGCSLTESLHAWEDVTPAGTTVAHAMMRGERLESALHHLPQTTAGYRLAHTILSAYKDGLPVVNTVHRLTSDAHNDMRHATETLIRQLPGRLSAPVVLCILPSFLIIAVVPLLVHSLGQLGPSLSPALTAVS